VSRSPAPARQRFRGLPPTVRLGVWIVLIALVVGLPLGFALRDLGDVGGVVTADVTGPGDVPGSEVGWTVVHVVDGDTVDVRAPDGTEERVRVAGIDTPERGECGFVAATSAMTDLVLGEEVDLVAGSRDDRDRYGRLVRYVDVGGVDAGLALVEEGLAIARYDSRDGYGRHEREGAYVAADAATLRTACG
jgi:endonuclease YncB( thermonuclease family)